MNSQGRSTIYYEGHKYIKSGESKVSITYRCNNHLKKCKSRIVFNRLNETASKNEIAHNHEVDYTAYQQSLKNAVNIHRFGKFKN